MAKANSSHKKDKNLKSLGDDSSKSSAKTAIKKSTATSLKNLQSQIDVLIAQREDELVLITDLKQQLHSTKSQINSIDIQSSSLVDKKDLKKLKLKLKETNQEFHKDTQTLSQEILIFKSLIQRIKAKIKLLEQGVAGKDSTTSDNTILLDKIKQFEQQLNQFNTQKETSNQALYEKIIQQTEQQIKSSLAEQVSKIQLDSDKKYEQINAHFEQQIDTLLAEKIALIETAQKNKPTAVIEQDSQLDTKLSSALSSLEELHTKQEALSVNHSNISSNLSSLSQELKENQDSHKSLESHQRDIESSQLEMESHQRNIKSRQQDLENYQKDMEAYQQKAEKHQNDIEILQSSSISQLKKQLTSRSQIFLIGMLGIFIISTIIIVKNNSNNLLNQSSLIAQLKTEINDETQKKLADLNQQNTKNTNQQLKQLEDSIQKIKYETKSSNLTTQSEQEVLQKNIIELTTKVNSISDNILQAKTNTTTAEAKQEKTTKPKPEKNIVSQKSTIPSEAKSIQKVPKQPAKKTVNKKPNKDKSQTYYCIQLLAARKQATIDNFIKKHQLSEHIQTHKKSIKGTIWYAVVYGQYPSSKAAIKAIKQLPAEIQANKPWVKKLP